MTIHAKSLVLAVLLLGAPWSFVALDVVFALLKIEEATMGQGALPIYIRCSQSIGHANSSSMRVLDIQLHEISSLRSKMWYRA